MTNTQNNDTVIERLEQWKQEATDPQHPNYGHADLDQPVRMYTAISDLLDKLRTTPESFSRDDVVALFGNLNAGQRMKNKVADENPLAELREQLVSMLYGDSAPAAKIAAASSRIRFAASSMLGELYGWAHADTAPLYNDCATEALAHLGYEFDRGDYDSFVAAHEQFRLVYQQHVGQLRPDLPLNLEIDKLYNVIDKVDLKPLPEVLASPFNEMFRDLEEANWAFDLLAMAAERLGLEGSEDPIAAFNLRRRGGAYHLRLSYGTWLILGFSGNGGSLTGVHLALLADRVELVPLQKQEFTQKPTEAQVALYLFAAESVHPLPDDIRATYEITLDHIKERFSGRQRSLHRHANKPQIAAAVFDRAARDRLLRGGIEAESQRFWKIAPGANAWNWDACREGGFIAIGWDELGDISGMSREEFVALRDELVAELEDWTPIGADQVWTFAQIQEGDRVVANRGTTEVLGIGTVTGPYYFVEGQRHGHRLPVQWDDVTPRQISEPGWRRTLIELESAKFEALSQAPSTEVRVEPECPFSEQTFQILTQLHKEPTYEFYVAHKDTLKDLVVEPFKQLMMAVRDNLPSAIRERMETEKYVFSNILKQFALQGCWDFYWGAFYPKGGKRTEDAQLFLWINRHRLEFGFYIGQYGSDQRNRFLRNCRENYDVLVRVLRENLPEGELLFFGEREDFVGGPEDSGADKNWPSFRDWFRDPAEAGIHAAVFLPKKEVLQKSQAQLAREIADVYQRLFPLVLLAALDNPMPAIGDYLGWIEPPETNPEYPLSSCTEHTGFEEALLARWVRAVERKGQAVVYGPPGTGKTYVAEHLARHLIGGGDGFYEVVQFHPAYAYEDFVQGIRPKPKADGQLDYPVVPGRFLDFCEEAKGRQGRCVLIIDEINRANLARVFGELMYLLEYRDREVPLAAGGTLRIPKNVRIIGTMNTADRSIALVDHALRRRFAFLALYPNYDLLRRYHQRTGFDTEPLIGVLRKLNRQIGDRHYEVGITFFLREDVAEQLEDIWTMEIEPYLEEYFFDQQDKVDAFRWGQVGKEILP